MENDSKPIEEPEFIKTIEKILVSLVQFILHFPKLIFVILVYPSKIFKSRFIVTPLTFFCVCLLLSSDFWYNAFRPSYGFFPPLLNYLTDFFAHPNPDLSQITNNFVDAAALTHTLLTLIPLILITSVTLELVKLIFKLQVKSQDLFALCFYMQGLVMIMPVVFLLTVAQADELLKNKFPHAIDLIDSFTNIIGIAIFCIALILLTRLLWIGSRHFFTRQSRYWFIKPVLFGLTIAALCCFTPYLRYLLYKPAEKKPDFIVNISGIFPTNLTDTTTDYYLTVKSIISNPTDNDKVLDFAGFNLKISKEDDSSSVNSSAGIKDVKNTSDSLKQIYILRSHGVLYLETTFHFLGSDCKRIYSYSKRESIYINFEVYAAGSYPMPDATVNYSGDKLLPPGMPVTNE